MNCLNKLWVSAETGTGVGPYAGMALGLAGERVAVRKFVSEDVELLERVDCLDSSLARLQATLWIIVSRRVPWQWDDGAIIKKIEYNG